MNLKLKSATLVSAAALIAATFSTSAVAQQRSSERKDPEQPQARSGQAEQSKKTAAARPSTQPERQAQTRAAPSRVEPRGEQGRSQGNARGNDPRGGVGPNSGNRNSRGIAVPRRDWRPGVFEPRRVIHLNRPYYAFRPRLSLGFGFSLGYSVGFPTWYNPHAYDAYYPGGYAIRPGLAYGGLSFDIQPYDAEIFVDGVYVGDAWDFGPEEAPLTLPVGRHRVDVRARGYQVMSFDAYVSRGQVLPFRGALGFVR